LVVVVLVFVVVVVAAAAVVAAVAVVDVAPAFAVLWLLWHPRKVVCKCWPPTDESDEFSKVRCSDNRDVSWGT